MKIYAVTNGSYSDYRIEGIYSTKEKAEEAHKLYASENDIEEYDLDALPEHPPGMLRYYVKMDAAGNVGECKIEDASSMPKWKWSPYGDGKSVGFNMWAEDETHAVKSANEIRAQIIASNQWTTDWAEWLKREVS